VTDPLVTGPLAQQFASLWMAIGCAHPVTSDEHDAVEAAPAALSAIERHVQDMEKALSEIESKPYRAEEVIARFQHRRWGAALPAREKEEE